MRKDSYIELVSTGTVLLFPALFLWITGAFSFAGVGSVDIFIKYFSSLPIVAQTTIWIGLPGISFIAGILALDKKIQRWKVFSGVVSVLGVALVILGTLASISGS